MKAGQLVALCFEARTRTHIQHLQTRSFAAHKALNEFYDAVIPLADAYAEAVLGTENPEELVFVSELEFPAGQSPVDTLETLRSWIEANRADCGATPELQAAIDDIQTLVVQTLYKLKTLTAGVRLNAHTRLVR